MSDPYSWSQLVAATNSRATFFELLHVPRGSLAERAGNLKRLHRVPGLLPGLQTSQEDRNLLVSPRLRRGCHPGGRFLLWSGSVKDERFAGRKVVELVIKIGDGKAKGPGDMASDVNRFLSHIHRDQ